MCFTVVYWRSHWEDGPDSTKVVVGYRVWCLVPKFGQTTKQHGDVESCKPPNVNSEPRVQRKNRLWTAKFLFVIWKRSSIWSVDLPTSCLALQRKSTVTAFNRQPSVCKPSGRMPPNNTFNWVATNHHGRQKFNIDSTRGRGQLGVLYIINLFSLFRFRMDVSLIKYIC